MIRKSLGFVTLAMLLSACVTERVIVMEPKGGSLQVAGDPNAQNTGDGDWGIRGPDAEEYQQTHRRHRPIDPRLAEVVPPHLVVAIRNDDQRETLVRRHSSPLIQCQR